MGGGASEVLVKVGGAELADRSGECLETRKRTRDLEETAPS